MPGQKCSLKCIAVIYCLFSDRHEHYQINREKMYSHSSDVWVSWIEAGVFEMFYQYIQGNGNTYFRCSWSFQIHKRVYFPPHRFYMCTRINADVSYALASRGEFYSSNWGATSLSGLWGGENKQWLSSRSLKGWWGVCLEKDISSLLFCCIETVSLHT